MAVKVAGERYESITGQLFEIGRQLRQPKGYPFNPAELQKFLQRAIEGKFVDPATPKARRGKNAAKTFNEATFFQIRHGLWVDYDLKHYVGLEIRATRGAKALRIPRLLVENENEVTMLGQPGSAQYAETLPNAVDLGQIAELIEAQKYGQRGVLLNNGYANLFPVLGKDGALHVVVVLWRTNDSEWFVSHHLFDPCRVWSAGHLVFSN